MIKLLHEKVVKRLKRKRKVIVKEDKLESNLTFRSQRRKGSELF